MESATSRAAKPKKKTANAISNAAAIDKNIFKNFVNRPGNISPYFTVFLWLAKVQSPLDIFDLVFAKSFFRFQVLRQEDPVFSAYLDKSGAHQKSADRAIRIDLLITAPHRLYMQFSLRQIYLKIKD